MNDEMQQYEVLLRFFKAVGQPDRLKILGLLANQAYSAADLVQILGIKQKVVSRHLRALQQAGLISSRNMVTVVTYHFNPAGLQEVTDVVTGSPTREVESYSEIVLNKYVAEDRLQSIPIDAEEREVILQWMAGKFDPARRYSEKEVTELVGTYFDKPLILRRALADNRFLLHTGRHYWRPIPGRNT